MSSIKDQLLSLGLVDARQAKRAEHDKRVSNKRKGDGAAHAADRRAREDAARAERDRRDFLAYREWARISREVRTEAQTDYWAELLRRARYNIHFHCWIPEDIRDLFHHLAAEEATPFEILMEACLKDGWEFAFLLKALKGGK